MRRKQERLIWFGVSVLGVLALSPSLLGQASQTPEETIPVPTDWSHSHLIFSRPATPEQAVRVEKDPRYWQQRYRRELPVMAPAAVAVSANAVGFAKAQRLKRDWQESMKSGASVGASNYPAKFSFLGSTTNCGSAATPDFVTFSTGLAGSGTQASIVAYDNLYSGCGAPVPAVYWAYNTSGTILTSPVYSIDGKQVAFVQTNGGFGILVALKWAAGTGSVGGPATPTHVAPGAYSGCTAPCMTTVLLKSGSGTQTDDTTSSIFYDYTNDIAWVGGALGWLHKVTGVFKGTPTEVTTLFPVQLNPGNPTATSSPVYDRVSGNVYVGDAGGFLYRVSSTTGVATKSNQIDHGAGLIQPPAVDSTAQVVYAFSSSDGTPGTCGGGKSCAGVYKLPAIFASGASGLEVKVGNSIVFGSGTPNPLYLGAFDSTYMNSATPPTGNLYVCGNTGGAPTLYRVPIAAGVMGTPVAGPVLSTSTTPCSPMTDILNSNATGGATEWMFASAETNGTSANAGGTFAAPVACGASGCLFNFKDTPWQATHVYTAGQEVLDSHFQIQAVSIAGASAATTPAWSTTVGTTTIDGGVTWLNQGALSASTGPWTASTDYAKGFEVFDSNGNVELATKAGTSNAAAPTWKTAVAGVTAETGGGPHWLNVGPIATYGAKSAGGTSGIIIDNTVGTGGGSQVYFSTLSDQTCATSGGTGGCAVQASQSGLK
jgi:hypothetical protein